MSLSDLKRAWILKQLGLSSSTLSESDLLNQLYADQTFNSGVRRVKLPKPPAGRYYFPVSPQGVNTLAMANTQCRSVPWIVEDTISIDRIGAEITAAGEATSTIRLGIWDDLNSGPNNLVLDSGPIAANAVAVVEAVCDITLNPGVYWLGLAAQNSPVTPPTIRSCNTNDPLVPLHNATQPLAAAVYQGYIANFAGAFPASWGGVGPGGAAPRLFVRTK